MVVVVVAGAVIAGFLLLALTRRIAGRYRPEVLTVRGSVRRVGDRGHVLIMPFGDVLHTASGDRATMAGASGEMLAGADPSTERSTPPSGDVRWTDPRS